MRAIQEMTAAEIRSRLDELADEQAKHDARDFDAELATTLRSGGNVDALEAAQLDAERTARRLRVEKTALETELPLAVEREGKAAMSEQVARHDALVAAAEATRDTIVARWAEFSAAVREWSAVQKQAAEVTSQADQIANRSKIPLAPGLGHFQSEALKAVLKELVSDPYYLTDSAWTPKRGLQTTEQGFSTSRGYMSRKID